MFWELRLLQQKERDVASFHVGGSDDELQQLQQLQHRGDEAMGSRGNV